MKILKFFTFSQNRFWDRLIITGHENTAHPKLGGTKDGNKLVTEMDEMVKGRKRKGKWCTNFMSIKKSYFVWGGKGRQATVQGLIVTKFKC